MSQIFEKIARGDKLNPQETQMFAQFGNRLEALEAVLGKMTQPNQALHLQDPIITSPLWGSSPLGVMEMRRTTDLIVPDSTPTYITFDAVLNRGNAFYSSDSIKIQKKHIGYCTEFTGVAVFAPSAVGYRALYLEQFDSQDNSLGASPFFLTPGHDLEDNWIPLNFVHNDTNLEHFKVYAYQTSGADLTLKDLYLTAHVA